MRGDDEKLYQVIQNFIDNAVKYTKKGSIAVTVEEKNGEVVLSVEDSGMGIESKVIPLLFHEFVRDKNIAKEIHGTGMGLYIARTFVEAQGGKVWVESPGLGKGSTFYLSLPIVLWRLMRSIIRVTTFSVYEMEKVSLSSRE